MEDPHNYEARANIMWAGMVCHNDIMGVGRQQDWNSHHLEHVLSAKYDCAHGAGLAVIHPILYRHGVQWSAYFLDYRNSASLLTRKLHRIMLVPD